MLGKYRSDGEEWSEEAKAASDRLDKAVRDFFLLTWDEDGTLESGDYISDWALVVAASNLDHPTTEYVDQSSSMAPHVIKGLFRTDAGEGAL
jgi:hypothetical protein